MEAKDLIGNTLIKKITNSKGTTWKPVLRQRWIGKFKGLKDYNRASLKDNYLIVEVGGYFDGPVFNPDPFIVVAGERIYLNYENSIAGPCRIVLVDIKALELSKKYAFNDRYQEFDAERDKFHVAKLKSFDEMKKLAKKQYSINYELPMYEIKMAWEQDKTSETYGTRHYSVTTNVGLSEELDEELLKA